MSDAHDSDSPHRRPHPQNLSESYLEFDLAREVDQLNRESAQTDRHNAKTLVKHEDFRIVLIALGAGSRIPQHHTDGRISIQTLSGHVQVRAQGRTFDLPAGSLVAFDRNIPHDVEALRESSVLLTIAWRVL